MPRGRCCVFERTRLGDARPFPLRTRDTRTRWGRRPTRFRPPACFAFTGRQRSFGLMIDSLSARLGGEFDRLRGRGALTEADVRGAMREVRIALLEADVALPVARDFVEKVT